MEIIWMRGPALIIGVMAMLAVLESLVPFVRAPSVRRQHLAMNLGLNAATLAINVSAGIAGALIAEVLRARGFGLLARVDLPGPLLVCASIVVLDASTYAVHRLLHSVPWLWRFHRLHHSDPLVDVTTSLRQHPFETLLRLIFAFLPAWLLGLPAEAIAIHRLIAATNGLLEHTNVRLWVPLDSLTSLVWVTPNVHKVHHSRLPAESNTNFGNILSVFDRALGTFKTLGRDTIEYGLDS
jgi:sterol desaturase/sphingolipid hydroxylase (fatty acid hydroxylase superfamily)